MIALMTTMMRGGGCVVCVWVCASTRGGEDDVHGVDQRALLIRKRQGHVDDRLLLWREAQRERRLPICDFFLIKFDSNNNNNNNNTNPIRSDPIRTLLTKAM